MTAVEYHDIKQCEIQILNHEGTIADLLCHVINLPSVVFYCYVLCTMNVETFLKRLRCVSIPSLY